MDFLMKGKTGPGLLLVICFDLSISLVISSAGKASSTPCIPKSKGGKESPPPHHCPSSWLHTHTGLSFESAGLDLKFLFRACHAFYMHGERGDMGEGLGVGGGGLQSKWTSPHCWPPRGCSCTPQARSSLLNFLHPLSSSNISFTASCLVQIPRSSERAAAFED